MGVVAFVLWIMKTFLLSSLVLVLAIYNLDALVPASTFQRIERKVASSGGFKSVRPELAPIAASVDPNDAATLQSEGDAANSASPLPALTHGDLIWKLRPPPEYPRWRRIFLRLACNVVRLEFLVRGRQLPTVLCPKGGKALLECYIKGGGRRRRRPERIAKFGFTTEAGAPISPIQDTVQDLYGRNPDILVRTGAIIYMFVEPQYRKRDVGSLGLEVISLVQACQNLDFCVLVANDKGSGKLVAWYERHNFRRAPKLQDAFGSPNAVFGVTMIAPTKKQVPDNCTLQWW
jgi:GNAT superfamily N-acetyltransferase